MYSNEKGGSLESIMSNEAVSKITESLNIAEKEKVVQVLNAGFVAAISQLVMLWPAAVVVLVIIARAK